MFGDNKRYQKQIQELQSIIDKQDKELIRLRSIAKFKDRYDAVLEKAKQLIAEYDILNRDLRNEKKKYAELRREYSSDINKFRGDMDGLFSFLEDVTNNLDNNKK